LGAGTPRRRGWLRRLLGRGPASGSADLGRRGEDEAARHLKSLGMRVLARNVRVGALEGDLVCEDRDGTVVLVEVKARLRDPAGPVRSGAVAPEAAVNARKRRALRTLLGLLARRHGWESRPKRIDLVTVEFAPGTARPVALRHIPGAVGERG
jgi:putative endonuclease